MLPLQDSNVVVVVVVVTWASCCLQARLGVCLSVCVSAWERGSEQGRKKGSWSKGGVVKGVTVAEILKERAGGGWWLGGFNQ